MPSSCRSWCDCGGFSSCFVILTTYILLWRAIGFSCISSLLLYLFSLSIFCKSDVPFWVNVCSIYLGQLFIATGGIFSGRLESFYSSPTHGQLSPHSLPDALVSSDTSVYLFKKYSHSLSTIIFSHSFSFSAQLMFVGGSMSDAQGLTIWPNPLSNRNLNNMVGSEQRICSVKSV